MCFWHFKLTFWQKNGFFLDVIFQLHPIINPLILDQLACSLPKTNTTFHQLFKYVKKDAIFSTIRGENIRNIFGSRSLIDTVYVRLVIRYLISSNIFFTVSYMSTFNTIFIIIMVTLRINFSNFNIDAFFKRLWILYCYQLQYLNKFKNWL